MKRRSVLKLAVMTAAAGSAGCTQFLSSSQQYSLWFIRIHNGSTIKQRVDIRVLRGDELIFEHSYDNIPSFQNTQHENSSFAMMESARLIEREWEIRADTYSIEYRLAEQDSFERIEVGGIDKFDAENIGVNMQIYSSGPDQTAVGFDLLEFDSEDQAEQFVTTVTNQSDD